MIMLTGCQNNSINELNQYYLSLSSSSHAVVIIGYNDLAKANYIHNPWYDYKKTVAYGGTYVAEGYQYKWSGGAVYNITK